MTVQTLLRKVRFVADYERECTISCPARVRSLPDRGLLQRSAVLQPRERYSAEDRCVADYERAISRFVVSQRT
jgi:hypothetical protein